MKKKLFVAALAAVVLASAVGAQQSLTNVSTAGVFKTGVDNYTDVNEWQGVDESLDKAFLFTDFYAAKRFGSLYTALFFDGYFPSLKSKTGTTDNETDDSLSFGGTATGKQFDTALLFGLGNLGIKVGGTVAPNIVNSEEDGVISKSDRSKYDVYASAGMNFGAVKPYLAAGWHWGKTSAKSDNGTTVVERSDGADYLYVIAGSGFDLAESGNVARKLSVEAENKLYFYPKNLSKADGSVISRQNKSRDEIILTPSYKAVYEGGGKFRIGIKASLPVTMGIEKESVADASAFSIDLSPALGVGLQYAATEKLTLNAGAQFTLAGLFGFSSESSGSDKSVTVSAFDSFALELKTGVSYAFTPKVLLDTNFTLLRTTVGSATRSDSVSIYDDYGTSLESIWKSRIGLQLTVRL